MESVVYWKYAQLWICLNQPPTSNSYKEILKRVAEASCREAHESLIRAGKNLKRKLISSNPEYESLDVNDLCNVGVSIEGTWQKRYRFNSFLGVVFTISVESWEVLDYEVKSKFCFEYKARGHWDKNSDRFKSWYLSQEIVCSINHTSSPESMEKAAAVEMFGQSISLHNLKYTTYVGNRDSPWFGDVCESMKKIYI